MKILVVLCCVMALAHARVVNGPNPNQSGDEPGAGGSVEELPATDTNKNPGAGGSVENPGAGGSVELKLDTDTNKLKLDTDTNKLNLDTDTNKIDYPEEAAEHGPKPGEPCPTESPEIAARLPLDPLEQPPPINVVTDKSGSPITEAIETEFTLAQKTVKIFSEAWKTYYTAPPTKVNCLCQTRGPLSRFKLIGNLHFKNIKVPQISARRFSTTENPIGECPPCNCADCFTTVATTKRKRLC